jgi:hypothetical protein
MNIGRIFDIFMAIVGVGMATVIVSSKNTSTIIKAWGDAFSGSLSAAMGQYAGHAGGNG